MFKVEGRDPIDPPLPPLCYRVTFFSLMPSRVKLKLESRLGFGSGLDFSLWLGFNYIFRGRVDVSCFSTVSVC